MTPKSINPVQVKPVAGITNTLDAIADVQNETEEILEYLLKSLVGEQLDGQEPNPDEPFSVGFLNRANHTAQWRLEKAQRIRNAAAQLRDALLD